VNVVQQTKPVSVHKACCIEVTRKNTDSLCPSNKHATSYHIYPNLARYNVVADDLEVGKDFMANETVRSTHNFVLFS
jgi:hypothetical protein